MSKSSKSKGIAIVICKQHGLRFFGSYIEPYGWVVDENIQKLSEALGFDELPNTDKPIEPTLVDSYMYVEDYTNRISNN